MSNLQLRKEVRDGVEFFVSNDGEQVGMSALGVATLSGVSSASIDALVKAFGIPGKLPSEALEEARNHHTATGLTIQAVPNPNGGKPVSFIPAEICADLIHYYAFEATRISPEVKAKAKYAYRQFAAIGIKTWILQITGFKSSKGNDLVPVLQNILAEMREIRQLKLRYIHIKDTVKDQPGLDEILEEYEQGHLITDGQYYTLQTWLKAKGEHLDHSEMTRLGILVGTTYKAHHRRPAPKMRGDLLGNRSDGKVNVYTAEDIPLLESALKTFRACMSA